MKANAMSYALLLAIILVSTFVPKVTQPMYGVMEPISEAIVGSAFWLVSHVSGNAKTEPPLIEAIENSDVKKVQRLVSSSSNLNERNSAGFPALEIAAGAGDAKIVKLLLDAGADVNARSTTLSDTALASAAQLGNPETVRLLVQAGADIEARDGSGWTPLFNAALSRNSEIVQMLLTAGADVNARTSAGWTALKEAQMRGYEDIVQQLKSAGAIDFPDGKR